MAKKQRVPRSLKIKVPNKKQTVYGLAGLAVGITAAVMLGVAAQKDEYKTDVLYNFATDVDSKDSKFRTVAITDFDKQNKIQVGEAIKDTSSKIVNWGKNERLIRIERNPIEAALSKNRHMVTYVFADTTPVAKTNPSLATQADDEAYDSPATTFVGTKKNDLGEEESFGIPESSSKYQGQVPADYDSAHKRFHDEKTIGGIGDFKVTTGKVLHSVRFDPTTGKIISIEDADGDEINPGTVSKLPSTSSKEEFEIYDDFGNSHKEHITIDEAVSSMQKLVDDLGKARGVTSDKATWEAIEGKDLDTNGIGIASIIDIPDYIKLDVSKELGGSVTYHLSFDKTIFPELKQELTFTHDIVLYKQPGGSLKVLEDAVKYWNKNLSINTYEGTWDKSKLEATGFEDIDVKNGGFDEIEKHFGIKLDDLNWQLWAKKLPAMKLQYKIDNTLTQDGVAQIEFRPQFDKFYPKTRIVPISVNIKGITQAIVDEEQARINNNKGIFNLNIDDIKLSALNNAPLTDSLAKEYGVQGLLDSKFDYTISHPEVSADGKVAMKIKVTKGGVTAKLDATPLNLQVSGISAAKALSDEQKFFNTITPTITVDDIKYDRFTDRILTQKALDALGITHTLDLVNYEYYLSNPTKVTSNGAHPMSIEVRPLSGQKIITPHTDFQMSFRGITDAQEVSAEQKLINALNGITANIDKINLPEAKDKKLTQALADELNLGIKLKSGYVYTYSHKGINGDTDLDVIIKVSKPETSYTETARTIKVKVTGIDRAIAIAGQAREQDEINDLAKSTYDLKIDDIELPANKQRVLKTDADFDAIGLTHRVKPGFWYYLNSPAVYADGSVEYKISVMIVDPKTNSVDASIGALPNVDPITFNITGIDDAIALKAEQEKINVALSGNIRATIGIKDLLHATVADTDPVEFKINDGKLTQLLADTLNLGITLRSGFEYHIAAASASADGDLDIEITVVKAGVTNRAIANNANKGTIAIDGIDDVIKQLGLDKAQNTVNGLAATDRTLTVDAASLDRASGETLGGDLLKALGITDKTYDMKVSHPEMNSDGEMTTTVTLYLNNKASTITPVPFKVLVTGIENFKLAAEQERVNGAVASYDIPDTELDGLDATSTKLSFAGSGSLPLTITEIKKYGIKVNGKYLVMKPQYSYAYEFNDIDADGDKELTITVSGESTYDSSTLTSSTSPTPAVFTITGFARAQKEKDLAIEQDRLNNLPAFANATSVKEIQLAAGSGDLTQTILDKLFSMQDPADDTKTVVDPAKISHLALDDTKYTYTYSNPSINADGDLAVTIIAHDKDGSKEIETPTPFTIQVEGINAAVIQYINDIVLGNLSKKVIETTIDEVKLDEVLYGTNKAEPTEDELKALSLSFDKSSLQAMLSSLTGIDPDILSAATTAITDSGAVVGLSSWIEKQKAAATFHFYYELHACDANGNVTGTDLTQDGYVKFILHYNVEGQPVETKEATIHVTGITAENRRVELAAEQTRINSLGAQASLISETSLDQIEQADKIELTDELIKKYGLLGKDGNPLVLDPTMLYTIYTDKDITANDDIQVTITVADRTDPTLEVHDASKTVVAPTALTDTITGIDEQRAIVTQTDAQNEINALAAATHNMVVDVLDYTEESTPEVLATKADFDKYGIDFDPTIDSTSKSLGTTFSRATYRYEMTHTGTNADGTVELTITATVLLASGKVNPTVSPVKITSNVTGIDATKALKAEQEKVNAEGKAGSATFNVDASQFAVATDQPLDQAKVNEFGISITLNPNYEYTYTIPTAATASGPMDFIINVLKTGKQQFGTPEAFPITVTGIDEYKELHAAIDDIQQEADKTKTTPIPYAAAALQIDAVANEELTQDLADKFGLGIKLVPSKFTYTYEITSPVTADGDFDLTIAIENAGPIKSGSAVKVTFKMHANGIDSAKTVQADLDTVPDTMAVTQPVVDTVTDGYNTNEYNSGDTFTEDQIIALTKDTLSTTDPDTTIYGHDDNAKATWTYKVLSKTGDTLTIEVTATDGSFTTTKDITLTGFVSGTDANNFDYPTEEITKDLAAIAAKAHATAVTLPVSAHTDEALTQKWIDYFDLGIVMDSRFDYTFSNAKSATGDMDVTIKVVRKTSPDPALAISQVIKVAVTEAPSFEKVFTTTSFAHAALTDSTTLHGMPAAVINYLGGITDQLRGYTAKYSMAKIDYNTNVVEPLTVTLTSIDDPSNTFSFKIYMVVGDQSKATGEAKTLLDSKDILDLSTAAPTVIAEPTKVPADILQSVTTALKGITSTNAIVNALSFSQIASGTPLTESLLDQLNIDTHIGSAIGLIGEEFTVSSDTGLRADGDIVLTITPVDGSGSFDITVSVTGINAYKAIKDDLDGLSDTYKVEPRGTNVWTTNEYEAWVTKLTDDQLQRLTAKNEWTQEAVDETAKEVIRAPENGIVRHITIKSKTATELTLQITDVLNGVSYSREVTLNGFTDDSTITATNNLEYLHEMVERQLTDATKTPITLNNINGEGIPLVKDAVLTQEVKDFFGITLPSIAGEEYVYSTDKALSSDGTLNLSIKLVFPNNEITKDVAVRVSFATQNVFVNFDDISEGTYQASDLSFGQIKELKDSLGSDMDKDAYTFKDIVITKTGNGIGTISFDLVSLNNGASRSLSGVYLSGFKDKTIKVDNPDKRKLFLEEGQSVSYTEFNKLVDPEDALSDLPAGFNYKITESRNAGGKVAMHVQILRDIEIIKDFNITLTGIEVLNDQDGLFAENDKGEFGKIGVQKPLENPLFDSAHNLINNFGPFKAGQSEQFVKDNTFVLELKAHGQEKRILMMGYLEGTDKGVLSKAIGTILGDNDGTVYLEWNFLPMAGKKSINIGAFKGGMTSSRKEQLQTASFSQVHAMDFHGDFPNGGSYSIKTYGWDDKDNGPEAALDGLINIDTTSKMLPGNTWTTADGFPASDRDLFRTMQTNFNFKKQVATSPAELKTKLGANFETTIGSTKIVYLKPELYTNDGSSKPFESGFTDYPSLTTREILEEAGKSTKNINLFVSKELTKDKASGTKAPDWLLKQLGIVLKPGEVLNYSVDAITGDGIKVLNFELTDGEGVEKTSITLNINGFEEYNKTLETIENDLSTFPGQYDIKPNTGKTWTTDQYQVDGILTYEEVAALTGLENWELDDKSRAVGKSIGLPKDGIVRKYRVISKTGTSLNIEVTDTKDGIEKTRTFELKGFVVDPAVTMNDITYNHASVINELEKHDGTIVLISDADKDGIPQITNHLLTQEILDFYGIDITLKEGFTWLYSTDKDLSGDGRVALTIKAMALGGSAQSTINIDVKFIPLSMNIPLPSMADGTYDTTTIPADVLKVLKAKLGKTNVSDKYTFDNLAITNEVGGKGTFTVELIDKATHAKRDVKGTFFNVDSAKTITVPDAAKTKIYNNGDSLAIWQINKYLPVDEQLVELLPIGLAYKTEMSSNSDGDVVITVKIVDKDNELTQSVYTFKDVKFVTKSDLGQAAVKPGVPEFDSGGKLKAPFGPFPAGTTEQFVKDNTFVIELKAHGQEKRVLMMGYLEGTDKGVLSKALGTILGDNDGTIYVEWNFLPMAGHKSINVGAFKGGMPSSRKEQLQTASFSQLHALDFHGDFPNGGTYSIKTYTWDDKVNGPQAVLDGSLTADSFAQMQPGNTWISHDGITDADKAVLQKLADGFIKKLTPAQLASFRASAKMTWNGQELIYPKQVLAIPTELSPILGSTYEEYPKYENDKVLEMEQKMTSGFPVNLRVEESVVANAATDAPISDWLKNVIYVNPQGGETITYSAPAITANGNVDISVTLKEADGTETTYNIKLAIHGFTEYNDALKALRKDVADLGDTYTIKPRANHVWTTNEYKVGQVLTDDQVQRLTAVNEWTQTALDETGKDVIRPTNPDYGRAVVVKSKTGDSLVLELTEKFHGATVTKEITLNGFTDDSSITTPNSLEYLHEAIEISLGKLHDHIEIKDLDGMGIPQVSHANLSQNVIDFLGLSLIKSSDVKYTYTSTKEISADGTSNITVEAVFPGGVVQKIISFDVSFKEPRFTLSTDGLPDGTYDQKDLTTAQLDAFRKLFPAKMDMNEYSFEDIKVDNGEFSFTLRNHVSGAGRHFVKGVIIPASVRKSIDVADADKKIIYYTPGHNLDIDIINKILPTEFKLRDLPSGYAYSATVDKNLAGDAVITIKVLSGTTNVAEYVYTLTGIKLNIKPSGTGDTYFSTSSTAAHSPSIGFPKFDSSGKLISDWLGFKVGQTKDDIKKNVQIVNLYMSYGAHWQMVIGDLKNMPDGETAEISPKGKDTYKLKLSKNGIQSWVEGTDFAHYNSWSDIPTGITVLNGHGKIMRQGWAQPGPFRTPDKVLKDPTSSSNKVEQVSWLDSTGKWHFETGAWSDQLKEISQIYQMLFAPSNPGLPKTVTLGEMISKASSGSDVTVNGKKVIILGDAATSSVSGTVDTITDKFKEYPLPTIEEILEKYQDSKNTDVILHVSLTQTASSKTNDPVPQWLKVLMGLKVTSGETVTCSLPAIVKNGPVELSFELTTKDGVKHQYKFTLNIKDLEEYNLLIKDVDADLKTLSDTYTVSPRTSNSWSTAEYNTGDILSEDIAKRLTASNKDETDPTKAIVSVDSKYKRTIKVISKTDSTLTIEITESFNGISASKIVAINGFIPTIGTPVPNNINWADENTLDEMNALQDVRLTDYDGMGLPKVSDKPLTQELLDMLGIKLKLSKDIVFTYSIGSELSSDGMTDITINATINGKTTSKTIKINISFKDVNPYFGGLNLAPGSYQGSDLNAEQLKALRDGLMFTNHPEDYNFKDILVTGNRINLTIVNTKTGASRVLKSGFIILEPKSHSVSIPDADKKIIYYIPNSPVDLDKINSLLPTSEKFQPSFELPSIYDREVVVGKNSDGDATITMKISEGTKAIYEYTLTLTGLKAIPTDDAKKIAYLYFRSKDTVKTAEYSVGYPVFDSSGKLESDWLGFKAGQTKDDIKKNVQLVNLYMSYGAHWQIVIGDPKNMPDGETEELTPKGKDTYKLKISKNGIQSWVEGTDFAHYNSWSDIPTGISVLNSHGKIMRQGWGQAGPFRTPDKVFKDPTNPSYTVEQISWLDSTGKWHFETGKPDTWSNEIKEIMEIYRKLFDTSLVAQNNPVGWDELYSRINGGTSVTVDGKKAYVFGDKKPRPTVASVPLLSSTFNEFPDIPTSPASPLPSEAADEPIVEEQAPTITDYFNTEVIETFGQNDYPIDSPSTSAFAWSTKDIYKDN